MQQEKIAQELDEEMQERITAAKLLQGHIADLLPGVLNSIDPYMEAENREKMELELGPWLVKEVSEEVGRMVDSRNLLEQMIRDILIERKARYRKMAANESELSIDVIPEEAAGGEEEEEEEMEDEGDYVDEENTKAKKIQLK